VRGCKTDLKTAAGLHKTRVSLVVLYRSNAITRQARTTRHMYLIPTCGECGCESTNSTKASEATRGRYLERISRRLTVILVYRIAFSLCDSEFTYCIASEKKVARYVAFAGGQACDRNRFGRFCVLRSRADEPL